MPRRFDYGQEVRVLRNVHDDGTFPGAARGDVLVRRGSTGFVRDIGTFLQDQIVYGVHFLAEDRLVGCREHELQPAAAPWCASAFEVREKVRANRPLAIAGKIVAEPSAEGEVLRVLRDAATGVSYHVRFPGRTLQVPECALARASDAP